MEHSRHNRRGTYEERSNDNDDDDDYRHSRRNTTSTVMSSSNSNDNSRLYRQQQQQQQQQQQRQRQQEELIIKEIRDERRKEKRKRRILKHTGATSMFSAFQINTRREERHSKRFSMEQSKQWEQDELADSLTRRQTAAQRRRNNNNNNDQLQSSEQQNNSSFSLISKVKSRTGFVIVVISLVVLHYLVATIYEKKEIKVIKSSTTLMDAFDSVFPFSDPNVNSTTFSDYYWDGTNTKDEEVKTGTIYCAYDKNNNICHLSYFKEVADRVEQLKKVNNDLKHNYINPPPPLKVTMITNADRKIIPDNIFDKIVYVPDSSMLLFADETTHNDTAVRVELIDKDLMKKAGDLFYCCLSP